MACLFETVSVCMSVHWLDSHVQGSQFDTYSFLFPSASSDGCPVLPMAQGSHRPRPTKCAVGYQSGNSSQAATATKPSAGASRVDSPTVAELSDKMC